MIAAVIGLVIVVLGIVGWLISRTATAHLETSLNALERGQDRVERAVREELATNREEVRTASRELRDEVSASIGKMTEAQSKGTDSLRHTVEAQLKALQEDNAKRLEQMRQTVDEKLQGTLENRLGDSFRLVSERLELVHRGLGEMRTLATGVGDLKRVLTNVKTRGTWSEVQLDRLLEQALAPSQYERNVATKEGSAERVEFAIRLPGRGSHGTVWLPIDAKFPQEDYQRLIEAADRGDLETAEAAARQLEGRVKSSARDICDKYLNPPHTTDFAILFLPTEGLYAEVVRRPGLVDYIQLQSRIIVAGPMTLWAILNSLQMGFRTLAIEQRSSEVWAVLEGVRTEFGNFGSLLDAVRKKLQEASNKMDRVAQKTRSIQRRLGTAQEPCGAGSGELLGVDLAEEEQEAIALPQS
jgi:DNA recombination protein RmuC